MKELNWKECRRPTDMLMRELVEISYDMGSRGYGIKTYFHHPTERFFRKIATHANVPGGTMIEWTLAPVPK